MSETLTEPPPAGDDEYVFFHSGTTPTYRKITKTPGSFTTIPTIDISALNSPSPSLAARKDIAAQIHAACTVSGFFYLSNHGLPASLQASTFAAMTRFFALPHATKMTAHVQKNPAIRGFEPMFETRLDPRTQGDTKEAFTMGDCPLEPEQNYVSKTGAQPPSNITRPQNIWPEGEAWFRDAMYAYYAAVTPLAAKLIQIFALAFELPETAFDGLFKFPIWGMRALHYPPLPPTTTKGEEAAAVSLGAHSDFSWLTMVLQDEVSALEVLNKDGVWVDAPPVPGTFVCNVGQYLERQTAGRFVATVHRVRNKTGAERYSLPFFLTPDPGARLEVLECCVGEGEERGEAVDVGELYIRRVLPARPKHPTSIKYRDVPENYLKAQEPDLVKPIKFLNATAI
ncbi:2og-Fe oxygenase family protein [Lophium mytilinum]|uniref:2og-Fe oxygenase family protein n=1 Tax=Lophium mytilinum TaxID=390894 RepID=A0A6A6QWK9_9PEZI|nr:2og-Fe oxygenase family protein [Lophium mytilinum]